MLAIFQFDSASVSVLERLLAEGALPTLARLRERGESLRLETPATQFPAGAFPTLYRGIEVGDPGIFYPWQWSAPDQRVRCSSAFPAPPAVWERLAARGRRTLAVDPYESRAPGRALGTLMSGWQLKDRVVQPRWSRPAHAHSELERLFGAAPVTEEVFGHHSVGELLRLRRQLLAAPGRVADAATNLLAHDSFDLVWLTFTAAHLAGHHFWDLSQVAEREVDARTQTVLAGALADVYRAVDAAVARVLVALPEDCDLLVVSPVGMDVNTSRADLLPEMLAAVLGEAAGPDGRRAGSAGSIWRLRAALPAGFRARVAATLPDRLALEVTARLELRGMDWSRTRAFALPADNQGYVRLNLRGRERLGVVDPSEADALVEEICAGLATFHDPDGAPAVREVVRVADRFAGTRLEQLPDLVVHWSGRPATRLAAVRSPIHGDVRRRGAASGRSGNHTEGDAWALVVPGASRLNATSRPPRLVDVAATAASLAGAGAEGLPGEPLLAAA